MMTIEQEQKFIRMVVDSSYDRKNVVKQQAKIDLEETRAALENARDKINNALEHLQMMLANREI